MIGDHKKKIFRISALLLCLALVFTPYAFGDTKSELDKVNQERDKTQSQLKSGQEKAGQLTSEIKSLEKQIYAAEAEINSLEMDINQTKDDIQAALEELERLEKAVGKQDENLNSRLRAMYKAGEVGFLSVLFGSSSVSEFMTNMDMVQRIYDSDAKLLEDLQCQYVDIEAQKERLLNLKDQLVNQQENISQKEDALAKSKDTVTAKKKEVEADNKELEAQLDALNEEANRLTAEILGLQSAGDYIGGTMLWPSQASTKITSPFGNRMHPIFKVYKMHTGIDIGAAGGTNILAANAGTVISAGWNSGYGYMVMVDHGGGIVTLYAHSSKLLVKKGDIVSRGQVIALVGSTGNSTGNHLHFEVRVNGVYQNPLNYVSTSVRK